VRDFRRLPETCGNVDRRADSDGRPIFKEFQIVFDLIAEDDRRNVYAGELDVRPPGAPTTGRPRRLSKSSGTHCSGPDQEEKHTGERQARRGESGPRSSENEWLPTGDI